MQKEIGSNFWANNNLITKDCNDSDIDFDKYGIVGSDIVLLSTGRAAIKYALKDIKKQCKNNNISAVIPPYTCDTVLQPFLEEKFNVYTYDINNELEIEPDSFLECLENLKPTVVLIHRYFGFDTVIKVKSIIEEYRRKGVYFIEDKTQCLFSKHPTMNVDYYVGSFRKWAAIPDGGYCIKAEGIFDFRNELIKEDTELVEHKLKAFQLKHDYIVDGIGKKETFLKAYEEAEKILDSETEFFSMSKVSRKLFNGLDIDGMTAIRRQNYAYVYEHLTNKKITFFTRALNSKTVPLYMVIRSKQRKDVQGLLKDNSIYAPIVWPKPNNMPFVSDIVNGIYKEVLCLPIDQRYELDDMERMVNILNGFK